MLINWKRERERHQSKPKEWWEGWEAFLSYQHHSANPYNKLTAFAANDAWDNGWWSAHTFEDKERNR